MTVDAGGDAREAVLTVVGSGTLLPSATRSSASYHLLVGPRGSGGAKKGAALRSVLLDCGAGTLHALARQGIDWAAIDAVAVTHYHPDHIGDLVALLAAWRYRQRRRPLTLLGPTDLRDFLGRLAAVHGAWVDQPDFPQEVVELGPRGVWPPEGAPEGRPEALGLRFDAWPTPHTDVSIALRLAGPWGTLGYTGDTGPSVELGAFLAGCDVLVAECALSDPPAAPGHLTPASLATLATAARPGLVVTTHVYTPTSPDQAAADVRRTYTGEVVAGEDGMRVRLAGGRATVDPPAPRE